MTDYLKGLAQRRNERVEDLYLDLPIPTWDRDLVGRFEVLDRKIVEKFSKSKRSVESDLDFVLKSTREVYAYDPEKKVENAQRMEENEDYVRVEDPNGIPAKFDASLARALGITDAETARDVLLYCVKFNGIAIGGLAGKLINWMQNTDEEVAGSLSGE